MIFVIDNRPWCLEAVKIMIHIGEVKPEDVRQALASSDHYPAKRLADAYDTVKRCIQKLHETRPEAPRERRRAYYHHASQNG